MRVSYYYFPLQYRGLAAPEDCYHFDSWAISGICSYVVQLCEPLHLSKFVISPAFELFLAF